MPPRKKVEIEPTSDPVDPVETPVVVIEEQPAEMPYDEISAQTRLEMEAGRKALEALKNNP